MKIHIRFGLITGLSVSAWLLISFFLIKALGAAPEKSRALAGLFSILILICGIWLGLKETKKRNDGKLPYKTAVLTGIKISLITALIVALYSLLYCTLINPGFGDYMAQLKEKELLNAGISQQETELQITAVKKEFSTAMQVVQSLTGQSIMGTLASLIIGLFLKTK